MNSNVLNACSFVCQTLDLHGAILKTHDQYTKTLMLNLYIVVILHTSTVGISLITKVHTN